MTREENNKKWIEELNKYGISRISIDVITGKIILGFKSIELHKKFNKMIQDYLDYTNIASNTSNPAFDLNLSISLIDINIQEISEMQLDNPTFGGRLSKFMTSSEYAEVQMQAGITDVKANEIEGEVIENGKYWIKS